MESKMLCAIVFVLVGVCYGQYIHPTRDLTGGLAGGLADTDANDGTVQMMAKYAVSEIGTDYSLVEVMAAKKQVVAGIMYHMQLNVSQDKATGPSKSRVCDVKVIEVSWEGYMDLVQFNCRNPTEEEVGAMA